MFKQLRNIESAFRHVKLFTIVLIAACMVTCCFTVCQSYLMVKQAEQRIYLLANGKALAALSSDSRENIPVEARDQIKMFHFYFFTLEPDDKFIETNIRQALYLADASADKQYNDLKESGYYSELISGNVSEQLAMDSIELNLQTYPYYFRYYGTEKLVRPTATVTRDLVTEGYLRIIGRSDNNPHGFLVERWHIIENRDINLEKR
ncbi:conjugative transposon protein TraK [Dinghuibacter silviterrae]|uniref:Conjugative transposon TraK protein n=1 Tax=Dinghuibacter silviterrae TaxID=1539049 RepID=A0A4R8DQS4_9BACT|nr:conjugative transposon protein TraK [Dinghuibacter silviterrae]TDX00510.1 conjugative transposon TraK protein [Dinghuibacter silviterrae]